MRRPYTQHGRRHGPNGSDPIPGLQTLPQIVRGRVDASVETSSGSGWSSVNDFGGTFVITYDPPFSDVPVIVVSVNETTTDPPKGVATVDEQADYCTVKTYERDGSDTVVDDVGFNFIAIAV